MIKTIAALAWSLIVFISGVFVSDTIKNGLDRFFDRARPEVYITEISRGPREEVGAKRISIPDELYNRESDHPFLPPLPEPATVSTLRDYLDDATRYTNEFRDSLRFIETWVSRPVIIDPGAPLDEQRVKLLNEWTAQGNKSLEVYAQAAIGRHHDQVPIIYKSPHPEEWTDPERYSIHLDAGRYTLGPLDKDPSAPVNPYRRYWIYLRESDFRKMLGWTKDELDNDIDAAESILGDLTRLLPSNDLFLHVSVFVSNDGQRTVALQPFALLDVTKLNGESIDQIELEPTDTGTRQEVLRGGEGHLVRLISKVPISQNASDSPGVLSSGNFDVVARNELVQVRLGLRRSGFHDGGTGTGESVLSTFQRFGEDMLREERDRLKQDLSDVEH